MYTMWNKSMQDHFALQEQFQDFYVLNGVSFIHPGVVELICIKRTEVLELGSHNACNGGHCENQVMTNCVSHHFGGGWHAPVFIIEV